MSRHVISKIVSGGQTGVDRAALDVAIYLDIPHGGWCPAGRRAEDGQIPDGYQLRETDQRDYSVRTERNVIESDGTLILFRNKLSGGTDLTFRLAGKHRRPSICFDLDEDIASVTDTYQAFSKWIEANNISVLNVAGPRESSSQGIGMRAESFLVKALAGQVVDDADDAM